jgi:hypothetical protein
MNYINPTHIFIESVNGTANSHRLSECCGHGVQMQPVTGTAVCIFTSANQHNSEDSTQHLVNNKIPKQKW